MKFDRKKEEAIVALLPHRMVEEAANAAGIATRTLLRWLQIPEFRAEYSGLSFPTSHRGGLPEEVCSAGIRAVILNSLPRCLPSLFCLCRKAVI